MDTNAKPEYIKVPAEIAQSFYDYWKLTPPDPDHITGKVFKAFKGGLLGEPKTISVRIYAMFDSEIEVPSDWDGSFYDDDIWKQICAAVPGATDIVEVETTD